MHDYAQAMKCGSKDSCTIIIGSGKETPFVVCVEALILGIIS